MCILSKHQSSDPLLLHHQLDELVVCDGVSANLCMKTAVHLTIDAAVTVLVSLPDHLVDLVIGQLLTNGGHDVAELGSGNETVVIAVEDLEGLTDLLLGVGVLHLAGHHCEEFWFR
jgi:hypothetical protein